MKCERVEKGGERDRRGKVREWKKAVREREGWQEKGKREILEVKEKEGRV